LTALLSKGRIHPDISLKTFLREVEAPFVVPPITSRACVLALGLPGAYPKDPADRIIAATTLTEGSPLITADGKIQRSDALPTSW
jgi:PIN domain nuclease of toxin-antitoxin system